jgi:hypothetical protein
MVAEEGTDETIQEFLGLKVSQFVGIMGDKLNSDNCRSSEYYEELKQIERDIDWNWFGQRAEDLLKGYGKEYYIKEDLRRCME